MKLNQGAPPRRDEFDLGHGVSIQFNADAKPEIQWNHIDGPMLHLRNATVHWLTPWERFLMWAGLTDEYGLERKHAPDFVRRWNAMVAAERNPPWYRTPDGETVFFRDGQWGP